MKTSIATSWLIWMTDAARPLTDLKGRICAGKGSLAYILKKSWSSCVQEMSKDFLHEFFLKISKKLDTPVTGNHCLQSFIKI
jgi:hypothetical protein